MHRRILISISAAFFQLALAAPSQASCGAAFCSVNTSWEMQGVWHEPGVRLDLRHEYVKQNHLHSGSGKTSAAGVPDTHDEVSTTNRNWMLGFDYAVDSTWGVLLQLPVVGRRHSHIHNDPVNGPESEQWDFSGIGDMRVLGRYQFTPAAGSDASGGIQFGIKLPSGAIDKTNDAGLRAERSLQPGSGSTDVLAGGYYNHAFAESALSGFIQGLWQHPVATRDGFKPGDQLTFDAGLRYRATRRLSAMLQLNVQFKGRDNGVNAEPADSGGHSVSVSPGLSYAVTRDTQFYGFIQLPVYQYVNGVQLAPDWSAVLGVSHRL